MPPSKVPNSGTNCRNVLQHLVGVHGKGPLGEVIAVAEVGEINRREQQDRGTANFRLAINVVEVLVRVVLNALLRLFQQLVAVAELGRAGGAGLSAGGWLALLHTAART